MKSTTIAKRLAATLAVLCLALAGLAGLALAQMATTRAATTEITKNWLPSIEAIGEIGGQLSNFRVKELRIALARDDDGRREAKAQADQAWTEHGRSHERLAAAASSGTSNMKPVLDEGRAPMDEIVASIGRVTTIVGQIAASNSQQSAGIAQVGDAVSQMDQVTQQNAALVEQSAAAAERSEGAGGAADGQHGRLQTARHRRADRCAAQCVQLTQQRDVQRPFCQPHRRQRRDQQ